MLDNLESDDPDQETLLSEGERDRELKQKMSARTLGALDQRERYIVEQRYMGEKEMSLAAIGRELGVSRERARQLEARAKQKLRQKLEGLELDQVA